MAKKSQDQQQFMLMAIVAIVAIVAIMMLVQNNVGSNVGRSTQGYDFTGGFGSGFGVVGEAGEAGEGREAGIIKTSQSSDVWIGDGTCSSGSSCTTDEDCPGCSGCDSEYGCLDQLQNKKR